VSHLPNLEQVAGLSPEAQFSLAGRAAIVTGATGGIGGWLAAGLGAAGAAVCITGRDREGLQALEETLRTGGIEVTTVAVDLVDADAPQQLVDATVAAFGRLDVLVNNAGVNRRKSLLDVTPEDFDFVMDVDLKSPYFLCQAVAQHLISAGHGGSIVNISSINALMGLEQVSIYGAAKAGLSQITRVMALEWARNGIRVNAIAPGFIETPLVAPVIANPEVGGWMKGRVPLGRLGRPEELVGLCQLLAADAGSFITGQTFVADGGLLAGGSWLTAKR
jgi:NAD(P)-dependent dehydrogenase (short-subunit alcohol dehydrogenase family)